MCTNFQGFLFEKKSKESVFVTFNEVKDGVLSQVVKDTIKTKWFLRNKTFRICKHWKASVPGVQVKYLCMQEMCILESSACEVLSLIWGM